MIDASLSPTSLAPSTVNPANLQTICKTSILIAGLLLNACIYRIDIQQGNLLEEDLTDQIEVGMTRSQVQFLLGSPMVEDSFHPDRWDYTYYFQQGRSREIERRWFVVYFQEDRVVNLNKNAVIEPTS
jgi:outer membrane protein assembly factor BamE